MAANRDFFISLPNEFRHQPMQIYSEICAIESELDRYLPHAGGAKVEPGRRLCQHLARGRWDSLGRAAAHKSRAYRAGTSQVAATLEHGAELVTTHRRQSPQEWPCVLTRKPRRVAAGPSAGNAVTVTRGLPASATTNGSPATALYDLGLTGAFWPSGRSKPTFTAISRDR
jgi:hypothetical protein